MELLEAGKRKGETVATMPASASAAADSADAVHTVAHAVDAANAVNHVQHISTNVLAAAFTNMVGLVGVLTSGIVSFIINHNAFKERKNHLLDKYRWFLASHFEKEPEAVTGSDLETFARKNPTLSQALDRARTIRNVHTTALVAASLIAMVVLTGALMAPFLPLAGWAATAVGTSFFSVATLKVAGTALAISYGTTKIGAKIFSHLGLKSLKADTPTAQDYIDHMTQLQASHQPVPEELVFGAYAAADPFVMEQIRKTYKKPFHELKTEDKAAVIEVMQDDKLFDHMNLKEITTAINNRTLDPKTLAFYAHKQEDLVSRTLEHIKATTLQQQMGYALDKVEAVGKNAVQAGQQAVQSGRDAVQGAVQGVSDTARKWSQNAQSHLPAAVKPRSIAPDTVRETRTGAQVGV